jgi:hypothetical protein
MPPKAVKTIRELLYWEEYAKLILPAAPQLGDYSEFYKKIDHMKILNSGWRITIQVNWTWAAAAIIAIINLL